MSAGLIQVEQTAKKEASRKLKTSSRYRGPTTRLVLTQHEQNATVQPHPHLT